MNRDPKSQKGPYRDLVLKIGTLLDTVKQGVKILNLPRVLTQN